MMMMKDMLANLFIDRQSYIPAMPLNIGVKPVHKYIQ